jgi:hypothetical protein
MIDMVAPNQLPKLPTPTTRDYKDGSADHARDGKVQMDTVARAIFSSGEVKLFNTPTTMDAKATNDPAVAQKFLDQGRQTCLTYDVATNWGKFGPAIRRWEDTLSRIAPAPTKPDGKEGNHRLSSKFTEWMMGLPDGWITNVGLTRNEELKLAGNGVVPQQAELALKILLENTPPPLGPNLTKLPTPTVSDTYTDNLKSTQQKEGSMHSVTLAQISQRI